MLVSRWRTRICRVSDDQEVDVISEGWLQFLFVAVPVLSLVGTWMGLRTAGRLVQRRREEERAASRQEADERGRSDSAVE